MPEPKHTYYVNYWCKEWRESARMRRAQAEKLAQALRDVGAEVQIVQVQLPNDNPPFPDPSVDYEVDRVQYRVPTLKYEMLDNMAAAEARQIHIQGLGLDVQVTIDRHLPGIPEPDPNDVPELPNPARWVGKITQQDRTMPAQLVLSKKAGALEGELSFSFNHKSYRVKVRGRIEQNRVHFTGYEAVQGNVYLAEYSGRLTIDGRLYGEWTYAPQGVAGRFDFALTHSADEGDG